MAGYSPLNIVIPNIPKTTFRYRSSRSKGGRGS